LIISNEEIATHLIDNGFLFRENGRATCPMCSPDRKKFNDKVLSVKMDGTRAIYNCHHCDETGSVLLEEHQLDSINTKVYDISKYVEPKVTVRVSEYDAPSPEQYNWLHDRGISIRTADKCGLVSAEKWIVQRNKNVTCIGFPYENEDGSSAVKWRDGTKKFTQTGVCKSLWRGEEFGGGDLVITEGEMDAISFVEIGVDAVSVPNGAPQKATTGDDMHSKKYSYLWDAKEILSKASRIIIAPDQDAPGQILPEEIARRVGKAKCWRMSYPVDCKDANDVLVKYGRDKLKELLSEVTPWPIGGLRDAKDYRDEAVAIWRDGMSRGVDLPVGCLSKYYRPSPQTLTICTGIPGSGKSTFLTWLSFQLAKQVGWSTAVFSAETSSQVQLLQLASLYVKKPFRGEGKMTEDELNGAIDWVSRRFVFLDESETSLNSLIERAQAAVLRNGVRILMVDPFNFVTVDMEDGDNGQRGILQLLTRLKGFAVEHDVAVWLVAHPTKMYRDSRGATPIPTGYDVSGSAHFFNIADSGITISREQGTEGRSTITSWKARFSWLGTVGDTEIGFNQKDGSFHTLAEWDMTRPEWSL